MDALESPVPERDVISAKFFNQNVHRRSADAGSGNLEVGSSPAPEACGCTGRKASPGACISDRDAKYSAASPVQGSTSTNIKSGDTHHSLLPGIRFEGNAKHQIPDKADNLIPSSSRAECTKILKKSSKGPCNSPCSKRPRSEQAENTNKPHLVREKVSQDGKRCDKRSFRGNGRMKFDSLASKNGAATFENISGGNNILGIYGLKPDPHDVTKDMDEVSLTELLDGSYKCPNLFPGKGRKGTVGNENILHSVRKACSVILSRPSLDSCSNMKVSANSLDSSSCSPNVTDSNDEEKCTEERLQPSKLNSNTLDHLLYHPKEILERLGFSTSQDLDSLLLDPSMAPSAQSIDGMPVRGPASLPPFSWSSSHNGSCKPTFDSGKLMANKYMCPGRWVRLGGGPSLMMDDHTSFVKLEQKADGCTDHSRQQQLDNLLRDLEVLTAEYNLPLDRDVSTPSIVKDEIKSKALDGDSGGPWKSDSKKLIHKLAEANLLSRGNEVDLTSCNSKKRANTVVDEKHPDKSLHSSPDSNSYSLGKSCLIARRPHRSISKDDSKAVYSPRMLAAAETLCEMMGKQSYTSKKCHRSEEKIGRPTKSPQMTMKPCKYRSSVGELDGYPLETKSSSMVKIAGQIHAPQKSTMSDKNSKLLSMNNVGRGPVRWTSTTGSALGTKVEKETAINTKQVYGNPFRQVDSSVPAFRVGKGSESHHKLKKMMVTTAGVGSKDWSTGRSRRE